MRLSARYITDRQLPDKAIDLIDEAGSRLRIDAESFTPELKQMDQRMRQLEIEDEAASQREDFEEAASIKQARAQLQNEYRDGAFDVEEGEEHPQHGGGGGHRDVDLRVDRGAC